MHRVRDIVISIVLGVITITGILLCVFLIKPKEEYNQKIEVKSFVEITNKAIKEGKISISDGYHSIEGIDTSEMNYKPSVGWFYVDQGQITNYAFYFFNTKKIADKKIKENAYTNCYVQNINGDIRFVDLGSINTYVNVKDYGAVGDGETLDTEAIKKATAVVNEKGGLLYFPYGEYLVDVKGDYYTPSDYYDEAEKDVPGSVRATVVNITSEYPVIIDLFNSTVKLQAKDENNNYPRFRMFQALGAKNVEFKNGTIIGTRANHDYDPWPGSSTVLQGFGHGIQLEDTRKALVYNLNIKEMTGDGIVVQNDFQSGAFETIIDSCEISYNRRMGITVACSDKTFIKNTFIHDIGDVDIYEGENAVYANEGQYPKGGIDIEMTNIYHRANLVDIDNTKIERCTAYSIVGNAGTVGKQAEVIIKNSELENPIIMHATIEHSIIHFTSGTRLMKYQTIKNCKIIHSSDVYQVEFQECVIEQCTFDAKKTISRPLIFGNNTQLKNVQINNYKTNKETKLGYEDFGVTFWGNVFIDNVSLFDCEVVVHGAGVRRFNKCNMTKCTIWSGSLGWDVFYATTFKDCETKKAATYTTEFIIFYHCNFYNTDAFVNFHMKNALVGEENKQQGLTGEKMFVNCYFELDSIDFYDYTPSTYESYKCSTFFCGADDKKVHFDACEIRIKGEIAFDDKYPQTKIFKKRTRFINGTIITLENYNSNEKLYINKDNNDSRPNREGIDYIAYYKGSETLSDSIIDTQTSEESKTVIESSYILDEQFPDISKDERKRRLFLVAFFYC